MSGVLIWNKRKSVETRQEAWYDRTIWRVPFRGTYNHGKVYEVIRARVANQFVELSAVQQLDGDTIEFETLYKIGD